MAFQSVAVLGLGNVGLLAARLLAEAGFDVVGIDHRFRADTALPFRVAESVDVTTDALATELGRVDAVLSCLPYRLNIDVADVAHRLGVHYFDLTEDVATTQRVRELATTSSALMVPQCGLAPGYVGIVGSSHIRSFERCRSVRMRVGALPQHPTGLLGYAFNWSPDGVVNEYLNDCEVIHRGKRKLVPPMGWHEFLYVHGVRLEAFTTSGGLGTMCETFEGTVDNLDYKTLRYPGHLELMNFFFDELLMRDRRADAGEILTNAKPPVDDDVVYVHVSSEGEVDGSLTRREHVRAFMPREVAGMQATAISWTTAASAVAVIELARQGTLGDSGFARQEDIGLDDFAATPTGKLFGDHASL